MSKPADYTLQQGDQGATVVLTGDWTAEGMGDADNRLIDLLHGSKALTVDLNSMRRCDTAGAYAILKAIDGLAVKGEILARAETRRLLDLVAAAITATGILLEGFADAQVGGVWGGVCARAPS